MLKNYFKIAWRNLLRNKVTSLINIVGLVIGMAVAMMIGLWVQDELTYNKFHKDYKQIVQVYLLQTFNGEMGAGQAVSQPWGPAIRDNYGSDFEYISMASWNFQHLITFGENRIIKNGMNVEPEFPKLLSLKLLAGTYDEVLKKPNSILLSESIAKTLFGEDDPMGQTIKYDSEDDLIVTGVFKNLPSNSSFKTSHFYTTWEYYKKSSEWVVRSQDQWDNHSFQLFAKVKEGTNIEELSAKIRDLEKPHFPNGNPEAFLFPMDKWHLYSQFKEGVNVGGRIQFVWMFGIIGVFVLLLACINFMNLSTARSERRSKEVGIRKAIGSMRSQLVWQFLTESFMITFLAMVFSIALVQISLTAFNNLADKQLSLPMENPIFWAALICFAVFTGLLAGSYPAFYLSSFEPINALKGKTKQGRFSTLPRLFLVTIQFVVSVSLIIGTIVVYQQINHAKNRPIGYDREGVIQFNLNNELYGKSELLRNSFLETGVVEEAAYSSSPITEIWSNQIGFSWEGIDPEALPIFGIVSCSHEFGKTVGWNILEGRDFNRAFGTDTSSIILNESGVKLTGLTDIVGKTIVWQDEQRKVIGVVKDMIMESPWLPVKPTIFHINPDWTAIFTIRLKPGLPIKESLATVQKTFETHSPLTPFEFEFTDTEYESKFRSEERIGSLAKVFAFLAIFISCLGLFGLSTFVAEQKTKEIGIRKVLGASVANLWAMQSKSFVSLVLLACLIASPIAWYFLDGWLEQYEYRIELNWMVFAVASFMALVVTLLTVSYQSIKAALANPIKSLRSE